MNMHAFNQETLLSGDQEIELRLLLEAIYLKYDYDFRNYSKPSILRQVTNILKEYSFESILDLQRMILKDPVFFEEIIPKFSVSFTEFFRDSEIYKSIREKLCPVLRTYPYLNIWHAGCSTGQEVYSLAILFHEEGLLEKSQFYGTDVSSKSLNIARAGVYPDYRINEDEIKYRESGGRKTLAENFRNQNGDSVVLDFLKKKILFVEHNLVSDGVFCEMNVILCRNVLIYFEPDLRKRVLRLFYESLCRNGFLCLGQHENLFQAGADPLFEVLPHAGQIYRRLNG